MEYTRLDELLNTDGLTGDCMTCGFYYSDPDSNTYDCKAMNDNDCMRLDHYDQ